MSDVRTKRNSWLRLPSSLCHTIKGQFASTLKLFVNTHGPTHSLIHALTHACTPSWYFEGSKWYCIYKEIRRLSRRKALQRYETSFISSVCCTPTPCQTSTMANDDDFLRWTHTVSPVGKIETGTWRCDESHSGRVYRWTLFWAPAGVQRRLHLKTKSLCNCGFHHLKLHARTGTANWRTWPLSPRRKSLPLLFVGISSFLSKMWLSWQTHPLPFND